MILCGIINNAKAAVLSEKEKHHSLIYGIFN